ncbi:PREDICTED: histone-lysine N-methyltransferase SETD7-like [Poecilia mexicana]|uniref:histone-lysine N-methyltransferase SETD7-like n=1 Tax=Poecilia mexicana TaxID=48701 RepID=UPI00072DCC1F|nr:PREDICTED: histone-lysine N-methyltransferase SETD7-like [Poecilia mexicana]
MCYHAPRQPTGDSAGLGFACHYQPASSRGGMDSDDESVEEVVEGPLDEDGQPHGFCTVTYSSSDRFEGHFTHGEKNGKGKFFFFDGR